jgi:hypothetical protein
MSRTLDHLKTMFFVEELWVFGLTLSNAIHVQQVYRVGLGFFDDLSRDVHERYLELIFGFVKDDPSIDNFLRVAHKIFESRLIVRCVKSAVLNFVIDHLPKFNSVVLDRLAEAVDFDLQTRSPSERLSVIPVFICFAQRAQHGDRDLVVDRILSLMSRCGHERFLQLQELLRPSYWTNDFLPLLSLLLNCDRRCWRSIVVFSHSLVSVGAEMFSFAMNEIFCTDLKRSVSDLLLSILKSGLPHTENVVSVLTGLLAGELDFSIVYKSCKQFGFFGPLSHSLDASLDKTSLLLPHVINDQVFANSLPLISNAPAVAQFFLSNYRESASLFGNAETPFEKRIRTLAFSLSQRESLFGVLRHPIASALSEALSLFRRRDTNGFRLSLDNCERLAISVFRERSSPTIFDKHRMFAIVSSISLMRQKLDCSAIPRLSVNDYYESFCLLPLFREMLDGLTSELSGSPPPVPSGSTGLQVVLTSNLSSLFERVCGFTSRGFICVGETELDSFLRSFHRDSTKIPAIDEHRWASLCFQVLCKSSHGFQPEIALNAYVRILVHADVYHLFVKTEAAARVITILRSVGKLGPEFTSKCQNAMKMVNQLQMNPFSFWTYQILELRSQKWFTPPPAFHSDPFVYAAMYALDTCDFATFRRRIASAKALVLFDQLEFVNSLEQLLEFIFSPGFDNYVEQRKAIQLLRSLPHEDLRSLRKRPPRTALERNVCSLLSRTIDRLMSIELTPIMSIDDVLPSERPFAEFDDAFATRVRSVNANIHFPVPGRVQQPQPVFFLALRHDVCKLGPDAFVLSFTNTFGQKQICRLTKTNGHSSRSFSHVVHIMRTLLHFSFGSLARSIRICSSLEFRVGSRFSMSQIVHQVRTLESYFELSTGTDASSWLDAHSDQNESELPKSAIRDQSLGFPTCEQFFKMRIALLRSIAGSSFVRELFSASYPQLHEFLISPMTGEAPIECESMRIVRNSETSHFRLSPNVVDYLGHTWRGEMVLAMGAVAQAMLQNFDSACAFLEIAIGDRVRVGSLDDLMSERDRLAQPILRLAPPCGPGAVAEDSVEWMSELLELIDAAANADLHPIECIPWF